MHKMKMQLGNFGAIFVSLILLAVVCALAIAEPEGMAVLAVVMLIGAAMVGFAKRVQFMGMRGALGWTTGMEKSLQCTAAIATNYTIAKHGADDDHTSLATAATDNLIGIFQHVTTTANDMVKLMLSGISNVVYGGVVTRGDPLTANASGKAIVATAGQSIIGYATISGVANDIGGCIISPQRLPSNAGVDGLTFKGLVRVDYDFAIHGGAVGAIPLGVTLPNKAVVTRGFGDIVTAFTSTAGTGTIALGLNTTTDLLAAVDADTLAAEFELIPTGTAANMKKATADREITLTVATNAILSGKAVFFLEYVISA